MKKKLTAIFLCVALVAVAVVGGTLAYFTDNDKVVNTFSIGNVDIDLYELTDYDNDGQLEEKKFQEYLNYSGIMPGDKLPKQAHIENDGSNAAYVRVAVVVNNLTPIQNAIDEVYEKMDPAKTENEIQDIYDNIFDGWGISHLKTGNEKRRMWMDENDHTPAADSGVELIGIDMAGKLSLDPENVETAGFYTHFSTTNLFQTETEKARAFDGCLDDNSVAGYYSAALNSEERIYVFYLKMDAGKDYTLFEGLNAPADFTAEQLAMFDGLKIGIYADAIQTENFETYTDAFNALEAAHPLGWWND